MKSSMNEMVLDDDEWELIPAEEGYLEINDDGGNKIYSRNHHHHNNNTPNKSVFQMNYFICPDQTQTPHHLPTPHHHPLDHHQPPLLIVDLPPPTTLNPIKKNDELDDEKVKRIHIPAACLSSPAAADPTLSQVFFFKKMKEVEFVDMKMDSPKSGFSKGITPQSFEEKAADPSVYKVEENIINKQQQQQQVATHNLELEESVDGEDASSERGGGVNIWKMGLNGIGAICSFGVAAATVCIIILGTKNTKHHHHNLHFQLYTSTTDKKMKQVFGQTSKLNEAAMRGRGHGVPSITTAHITFGGYYDAPASL